MEGTTQKLFTVAEANRALPSLKRQLERLSARVRSVSSQAPRGPEAARRLGMEGGRAVPLAYLKAVQEIQDDTRDLEDRGLILRDVERGLVDFPSQREGREVFLCWIRGESQIEFWHETDRGFAHRQPL